MRRPSAARRSEQGRQDSNLRHSVLETDTLPAELRPFSTWIVSAPSGHYRRMSDSEHDTDATRDHPENDLLDAQEHKGDGEDEGEREEASDDEAAGDDEQ